MKLVPETENHIDKNDDQKISQLSENEEKGWPRRSTIYYAYEKKSIIFKNDIWFKQVFAEALS